MKNYFYFAAMALAVMSSCSNDEVVDNPAIDPIDEEKPVAIQLGVSAPQALVSTKGLGTVGGFEGSNYWNGEKLYVYMLDAEGNEATEGTEGTAKILDNTTLTFKAPVQSSDDATDTEIKILQDENTIKAKYYSNKGAYSFYGYHIDNIQGTTATFSADSKTVSGITITGTEDLMAAKTKEVSEQNYSSIWSSISEDDKALVADRAFSAWTARRGIQPILQFNHLLTRLQFNVIAGNQEAAASYYDTDSWKENKTPGTLSTDETHQDQSTAVTINAIRVVKVKTDNITIDLENQTASSSTATAEGKLTLMSGVDQVNNAETGTQTPDGNLDALTPTSPLAYDANGTNYNETYPQKTPVGESIMLLPGDATIEIEIDLSQLIVDTESAADGNALTYTDKSETLTATLKASDIKKSGLQESANKTTFEAGESYTINITVYSYQRIEIDAELTPWEDGGEINIAPGDVF